MTEPRIGTTLLQRLDQLNEYEREPIQPSQQQRGAYFAGMFAGEHVAATEFVIGTLFVNFGASAFDVLVGLLLGNLLAVLSWALVCAPIAVDTRLTLYWYLRRIAGPGMMFVYNLLNALLFCILAGAMITVSASAVRLPFGIPEQIHWYPSDARFVCVVLGVGVVVVTLAIAGFKRLAQFASLCSPWLMVMFVVGAVGTLSLLGPVQSPADLWHLANDRIWTGQSVDGDRLGFWHVAAFAWICNLATHLGLADMALFRYARHASYGYYSAFGMYLGHYLAWICAGIMGATAVVVLQRPLVEIDSGSVAYAALGPTGALAVVLAGWTTANPTLYRAGLALQVITPNWSRWLVTLVVGVATTVIACFPFVFTGLLDFVGVYGLLLSPVGAIVVAEHWVFPRLGWTQYQAEREGVVFHWPAVLAWIAGLAVAGVLWQVAHVHLFFVAMPAWVLTGVVYMGLMALTGQRGASDVAACAVSNMSTVTGSEAACRDAPASRRVQWVACGAAMTCLAAMLVLAWAVWSGCLGTEPFKTWLVYLTAMYFVAGVLWIGRRA